MLEVISYAGLKNGPTTLILGSIHGDEICGTYAIDSLIEDIRLWKQVIERWKIILIPRANKNAYDRNVRQVEYNLNRIFGPRELLSNEHSIAKRIEEEIKKADFVVDLHSMPKGEAPFSFLEAPHSIAREFVEYISPEYIVTWWDKLYANTEDIDTVTYAISQWIPGVTIECGNHLGEMPKAVARSIVHDTLVFFGHTLEEKHETRNKIFLEVTNVFYKTKQWALTQDYSNFDPIKHWDILATTENWDILAPYDGVMIMPSPNAQEWQEWFYIAKYI